MNKKFLILVVLSGILSLFILMVTNWPSESALFSPLARGGKVAANLWFPQSAFGDLGSDAPEITAKSAYFVDATSGKVLYQKDPYLRLPVASLVKVMTAVIALENRKLSDEMVVSAGAANMEPDHMQLIAGETLTVDELLYGLFLVSGNDAAEVLAEGSIVSREEFIRQMNVKSAQLGMKDTLFINPSGLEEDGREQYSTAYDIALMSRFAIKNYPRLLAISSTEHIVLPQTLKHQSYDLYSGINLLTTYPGVLGFKTGYTPEAGLTLIIVAKRGEQEILGILLNSENRREEARQLLDYSFKKI